MVNYPAFNPDIRHEMKGVKIKNRVVTEVFEPGSTMKPFIILSALNANSVNQQDLIDTTPGIIKIGEKKNESPNAILFFAALRAAFSILL